MPELVNAAALTIPAARAAPTPSPWLIPKSSSGRKAGKQAVIERTGIGRIKDSGGRGRHEPVEQHRDLLHARRENGAADRRELASADPAQDLERIAQTLAMQCQRPIHDLGFPCHHRRIGARPRTNPIGPLAAEQRGAKSGGDRRIADPEIAQAQKIGATGDRFHTEGHGCRTAAFVERGLLGDVACGDIQGEVEDFQAEIVGDADLVDRGPAGGAELDFIGGRRHRPRRNPVPDGAMIAREDRHQRPVDRRRRAPAPGGNPGRDVLDAPKRFFRLFSFGKQRADAGPRRVIGRRQRRQKASEVVERRCGH